MDDPSIYVLTEVKGLDMIFDYVQAIAEPNCIPDTAEDDEEQTIQIRYRVGQLLTEAYANDLSDLVPENIKELLYDWCNYVDEQNDRIFNAYQLVDFLPTDLTGEHLVVILANRIV